MSHKKKAQNLTISQLKHSSICLDESWLNVMIMCQLRFLVVPEKFLFFFLHCKHTLTHHLHVSSSTATQKESYFSNLMYVMVNFFITVRTFSGHIHIQQQGRPPWTTSSPCSASQRRSRPSSSASCMWSTTSAPSNTCDGTASTAAEPHSTPRNAW